MRHLVRFVSASAQPLGQAGEFGGRLLGKLGARLFGLESIGIDKRLLQPLAHGAVEQVLEQDVVDLLYCVGDVGVDADAIHVGYDQQRRIL